MCPRNSEVGLLTIFWIYIITVHAVYTFINYKPTWKWEGHLVGEPPIFRGDFEDRYGTQCLVLGDPCGLYSPDKQERIKS